ncbi:hypothetical protein EWM64_g8205 [Hericium alpestre]|uniref:Fatty acid desaturase domain-containing protein n=1 Tax=Hericium alpestre TaxID=135208 RepID=A0A4Y9ZQM8_9AGAM|nr:hypothetical protein EWM64_g8205 [Hericium alpestre]
MGAKMYPKGTNHFSPSSPLFKAHQRPSIILSDLGVGCMVALLIVMFTYLHHSDPTIPHYYGSEWTFLRGAVATVDRPLLGWMGRFFLHNISHDHIAHHFFVGVPFCAYLASSLYFRHVLRRHGWIDNGPEITKHIRAVLGDDYNYDSTNTFYAFWRSFTQCLFIEESEDGGIAFYKNAEGKAAREVAEDVPGMAIQKNEG